VKLIKYLSVLAIGVCACTYFGFYQAPAEFMYWDSQYKATSLVFEIKALKIINFVIESNEIRLNRKLAIHSYYLDSKFSWMLPHNTKFDKKYIKRVVEYRLSNPYADPDMSNPRSWKRGTNMNDKYIQVVIEGQKENNKRIDKVLKLYGSN